MSDFDIDCITGGPFQTNAYLITDRATRHCAVVDPGYDADKVWGAAIKERGLTLEKIICTHGHIDHTCGVAALSRAFPQVPIYIHEIDAAALAGGNAASAQFLGLPPYEGVEPTHFLKEGEPISVGETSFEVLFVPGHCPGHIVLFKDQTLIGGDVVFAGSIGRTDLPGGNYAELADSILTKVMPLGDDVVVYSGHGPPTTIGREKLTNPFITEMIADAARRGDQA
jgi:glyoxylase-like metal-dependent hydrolase (beta-lactamase superfamily II)